MDPGYGGPAYGGDANPEAKGFEFNDESIRRGFIRKVYAILMVNKTNKCRRGEHHFTRTLIRTVLNLFLLFNQSASIQVQLSVSLGFICLCVFHGGTKRFLAGHRELFWVALAVLIVTMIAMACCEGVRRTSPTNFIFLGLFTLAQSFMLGAMTSQVPPETVMLAVGATAAVCLALTLFALQTKYDFTMCNGVLFVALILFMLFGIVAMFFRGPVIQLVYASLGALLFSVYLIYE